MVGTPTLSRELWGSPSWREGGGRVLRDAHAGARFLCGTALPGGLSHRPRVCESQFSLRVRRSLPAGVVGLGGVK